MTEPQRRHLMLRDAPEGMKCERCVVEPAPFRFEEYMVCARCCTELMPEHFFQAKLYAREKGAWANV